MFEGSIVGCAKVFGVYFPQGWEGGEEECDAANYDSDKNFLCCLVQRTPQAEQLPIQQSIQSEELYNKKLRTLNMDRVTLERDRQELQEAQRQLESERRQMLSDGVNVLAWYSAASEAAAVATDDEVAEKQKIQEPQKKKGRSLWGGKEGKQRSEEEDTVDNI